MDEQLLYLQNIDVKFFDSIRYKHSTSNGTVINVLHEYDRSNKKLYLYIDRQSTNVFDKQLDDGTTSSISVDDVVFRVQGVEYSGVQLLISEDGGTITLELNIEDSVITSETGFYVFVETTISSVYRNTDVIFIPNSTSTDIFVFESAINRLLTT